MLCVQQSSWVPFCSLLLALFLRFCSPPYVNLKLELSKKRWLKELSKLRTSIWGCFSGHGLSSVHLGCHNVLLPLQSIHVPLSSSHTQTVLKSFFPFEPNFFSFLFLIYFSSILFYSFSLYFFLFLSILLTLKRAASGLGKFGSHWWATFLHDKQLTPLDVKGCNLVCQRFSPAATRWGMLFSSWNSKASPDVPNPMSGHDFYSELSRELIAVYCLNSTDVNVLQSMLLRWILVCCTWKRMR